MSAVCLPISRVQRYNTFFIMQISEYKCFSLGASYIYRYILAPCTYPKKICCKIWLFKILFVVLRTTNKKGELK
ncbi:hypothetical protein DW182_08370 [Bacteroides sp. AM16-24]|nr:hypothetical protein DW182_08370 [Bacteroides sp. AM16-24]